MISPIKLIAAFQRCQNYPKDDLGVQALVQGLATASRETGVQMEDITERCAKISQYCPTDADLLNVAGDILADRRRAAEAGAERAKRQKWERDCGPARQFDWNSAVDWVRVAEVSKRRDRMYREIRDLVGRSVPLTRALETSVMAEAAERLGYHDYAYCWRRSGPEANGWSGRIPDEVLAKCSGPGVLRSRL